MSLNHSPSIVTNGLVFAYDMANTQKSWKGAPSTNYISTSPTWAGDGTDQSAFTKGYTEITNPDLMYYGLKTFLWRPGSSLNCYLQSDDIVGGTSTISATWTFSCYVKAENNQAITSMGVYMYFPSSDGNVAGTITDVGRGWYRITRTRTGTANYISLIGFTGFTANVKYYLSGAMLTMDSIPVGPLNGNQTRTTTQALLDLTGNNTITTNSLTYASDGTFSFNGTSNSLTIPFNASKFTFNSEQTIIIWMKNQSPSSAIRNPYDQAYGGAGTITHENDTAFNYYFGTAGSNTSPYTNLSSSFGVVIGELAMICVTRNASTVSWYKNGVFSNSMVNPYGASVVTGTNNITIGSGYAGAFGGNIYTVQLYNRALSAAEVKQNYNAYRGRYGQ